MRELELILGPHSTKKNDQKDNNDSKNEDNDKDNDKDNKDKKDRYGFIDFLLDNQYDSETMKQYQTYHDCGKPYCRTVDDEGKQHFPDHARVSSEIYAKYFDSPLITQMILDDMNYHTLKSEGLDKWFKLHEDNPKYLCSLYLTAWSEIISNSKMFGGMDSTSYKIKRKALIGAAKKLHKMFVKNT